MRFFRGQIMATIAFAGLLNGACVGYNSSALDSTELGGLWLTYQYVLDGRTVENLSTTDLIQPENWSIVQAHLTEQAALGRSGEPAGDLTTITGLPSTAQGWFGGVLTPDGKIYGCPNLAMTSSILIIDTNTDTADITTITDASIAGNSYQGGVLAPNGKIYCAPRNGTDNVMIIDPATNTVDTTSIIHGMTGQYSGGVLAPNGKIYFMPQVSGATDVMVVDPTTNTVTNITGFTTAVNVFSGAVLGPDGKIYAVPSGVKYVGIIDPDTDTLDETTLTFTSASGVAYYGGALAPDGTIHMVPRQETDALIVDPFNKTVDKTSITGLPGGFLYQTAALSADGLIYHNAIGGGATAIPIIDPVAKTFTSPNLVNTAGGNQFFDLVAAPNGKLYAVPLNADYVAIIDPKSNGRINTNLLTSAYFNNL